MMKVIGIIIFGSILITSVSFAKNLGVIGQVYPIAEEDFRQYIQERLLLLKEQGKLDTMQQEFAVRAAAHSIRPVPVSGLTTTIHPQTVTMDPSITVTHDIYDHQGTLIAKEGTRINPLDTITLHSVLLFFNADDERQVAWAQQEMQHSPITKIILTQGNLNKSTRLLNTRVYFDQQGTLTQHFGITHVPSTIRQRGKCLEIKEHDISHQGVDHA